ncbi:MAG: ABC transporter substrate-binding protein, partial [Nitrospinae bacterium]|nr:ABC transporter substrate-binding protein [Nitrospinota bacterium]
DASDGKWRVYDVVLDGVSMRNNLKSQFYKVIEQNNFAELVRRMKDKLDKASS